MSFVPSRAVLAKSFAPSHTLPAVSWIWGQSSTTNLPTSATAAPATITAPAAAMGAPATAPIPVADMAAPASIIVPPSAVAPPVAVWNMSPFWYDVIAWWRPKPISSPGMALPTHGAAFARNGATFARRLEFCSASSSPSKKFFGPKP